MLRRGNTWKCALLAVLLAAILAPGGIELLSLMITPAHAVDLPKPAAPQPGVQTPAVKPPARSRYPLAIASIGSQGDQLRIVIVNTGKGRLSVRDYARIRLHLTAHGFRLKRGSWSLAEVDPKHQLLHPHARLTFTVPERLPGPGTVQVRLVSGSWQVAKQGRVVPTATRAPPASAPMQTRRPTAPAPPMRAQRPRGSLEITRLRRCAPEGAVVRPGSSRDPLPGSITVNQGDELPLCWKVEGCGVNNVQVRMIGVTGFEAGTRVDTGDGCFYIHGRHTLTPHRTATYTLQASGAAPLVTAPNKSIRVTVRRPELTVVEPHVDQATGEVTFRARNTGDLAMPPEAINVWYRITGLFLSEPIAESSFRTEPIGIGRGGTVNLGSIALPAIAYEAPAVNIEVQFSSGAGITERQTFHHPWAEHTRTIGAILIDGILGSINVYLNNYNASVRTGDTFTGVPARSNDSWFEINGVRSTFSVPSFDLRLQVGSSAYRYSAFVRNLGMGRNVPETVIGHGTISVRIPFDTSASREIKGFLGDLSTSPIEWNDTRGPDVDLRRLIVTVTLRPVLRNQMISYSDSIGVHVDLAYDFAGGWSMLNDLVPSIDRQIRRGLEDTITSQLTRYLNSPSTRSSVEASLNDLMAGWDVHHIKSIETTTDGIVVTYR